MISTLHTSCSLPRAAIYYNTEHAADTEYCSNLATWHKSVYLLKCILPTSANVLQTQHRLQYEQAVWDADYGGPRMDNSVMKVWARQNIYWGLCLGRNVLVMFRMIQNERLVYDDSCVVVICCCVI